MYSSYSEEGIDLLKKMLEKNPHQRISAEEALSHNFLKCPLKTGDTIPTILDATVELP